MSFKWLKAIFGEKEVPLVEEPVKLRHDSRYRLSPDASVKGYIFRFYDSGDEGGCDCCSRIAPIDAFGECRVLGGSRWLCEICANTLIGTWQERHGAGETQRLIVASMTAMGWIGNMLRDEIQAITTNHKDDHSMKTKSALSYFGSDAGVAADLGSMLDGCKHVTIPFIGGASIIPHLKSRAIVANDLHGAAINFYRVLSGWHGGSATAELIQRCRETLSHPTELETASLASASPSTSPALKAWAFWAQCWIGRKGNGGTNATRIQAAAADLDKWAEHFKRCEWEQICFRELLPKVADNPECGIYCDPPWVGAGRDYLHTFTEQDHRDLASMLLRFERTRIVIRYGDDPLINELYPTFYWNWIEAESRTQANTVRGEVWITNRSAD